MRVPQHIVDRRREQLAGWMQQQGHVSLQEICARFSISEATARRDLAALAAERQIVRTYGGALSEYNRRFASFHDRLSVAAEGKRRIARLAHAQIRPGTTIFLDAGTTLYALAEELVAKPVESLRVITNSLPVAERLAPCAGTRVVLLGGELLPRQSTLVGDVAVVALESYGVDLAFIGAEAANDKGLWNSQEEIVVFQQRAASRAAETFYCLDACKFGATAPAFLSDWKGVRRLLTDAPPATLARHGVPTRLR